MPVGGLSKLLLNNIANQKNFAASQQVTDDEGGKSRNENHGDSTDYPGKRKGKSDFDESLETISS